MKVIAHSDAGSTESELKFATLTYHGRKILTFLLVTELPWSTFVGDRSEFPSTDNFDISDTITPLFITKKEESNFYEKTYIMIPLCFGIVAFLILIIAVLLYMRRRRELIQMKGM